MLACVATSFSQVVLGLAPGLVRYYMHEFIGIPFCRQKQIQTSMLGQCFFQTMACYCYVTLSKRLSLVFASIRRIMSSAVPAGNLGVMNNSI